MRASRRTGGFTLVELLVVIGIIAVLVALLMPAVQGAREAARRTECLNKIKQLGLGVLAYESQPGALPPGGTMWGVSGTVCNFNAGRWSADGGPPWSVHILPFMEDENRYDAYDVTRPFAGCTTYGSSCFNYAVQFKPNPAFKCPSDPNSTAAAFNTNYYAAREVAPSPRWPARACSPARRRRACHRGRFSATGCFIRTPATRWPISATARA